MNVSQKKAAAAQMLRVAVPKKERKQRSIYDLAKNQSCFDCSSGKVLTLFLALGNSKAKL